MARFTGRTGVKSGQLAQYASSRPDLKDAIFQPLYDYQTYATAGSLNFTFFALPKGQGTTSALGATGVKTLADTNMQNAGMLPLGNKFLVLGIEVEFWPGSTPGFRLAAVPTDAQFARNWDDAYNVLRSGSLTLNVQNRVFAQDAPLMKFPTSTRLTGVATYNENNSTATTVGFGQIEYVTSCGAGYNITPVLLESTQAFDVNIAFPAVVPTPSGVDARLGVRLVGKLVRNAQ
jgi:hypothetical protein